MGHVLSHYDFHDLTIPQIETFEFIEPVEFFTYLAIAVLTGGKFM